MKTLPDDLLDQVARGLVIGVDFYEGGVCAILRSPHLPGNLELPYLDGALTQVCKSIGLKPSEVVFKHPAAQSRVAIWQDAAGKFMIFAFPTGAENTACLLQGAIETVTAEHKSQGLDW